MITQNKNLLLVCLSMLFCSPITAQESNFGRLDSFEKSAVHQQVPTKHDKKEHDIEGQYENQVTGHSGDTGESSVFVDLITAVMIEGGTTSLRRANALINSKEGQTQTLVAQKHLGEALIPFLRVDYSEQSISDVIKAKDYRYELGYGPFAIHINKTRFTEVTTNDELDLTRVFGLYRMSIGSNVEMGVGIGKLVLQGNENNTQFLSTFPVLVHLDNHIGIEFRPAFTAGTDDYDLALLYDFKYVSLKAGYRWLLTNDFSTSLSGPYAGLSFHF